MHLSRVVLSEKEQASKRTATTPPTPKALFDELERFFAKVPIESEGVADPMPAHVVRRHEGRIVCVQALPACYGLLVMCIVAIDEGEERRSIHKDRRQRYRLLSTMASARYSSWRSLTSLRPELYLPAIESARSRFARSLWSSAPMNRSTLSRTRPASEIPRSRAARRKAAACLVNWTCIRNMMASYHN